jgi:hypothetical protein
MNHGESIFAQLMDVLSPFEFRQCVQRYNVNYKVKSFSCWGQLFLRGLRPAHNSALCTLEE